MPLIGLALTLLQSANSAVIPVPVENPWWYHRHEAQVARAKQGNVDLVMLGDSITHAFGGQPFTNDSFENRGKDSWDLYFGDTRTLNLGISGDRTQHVLWRLQHGAMDGVSPKVVTMMIGTNNAGANTADEISAGVQAVAIRVHDLAPKAKVLLLGIFPRGMAASPERAKLAVINQQLKNWAPTSWCTYTDIGKVFLDAKGEIPSEVMPDKLHPMAYGYRLWAMAMEPTLAKLLGRKPITQTNPMNSAVVPVTQRRDYPLYDWMPRHDAILRYLRVHNPEVVFIGDSITHRFGGDPIVPPLDNTPRTGLESWKSFSEWRPANLGYGWDRTENVLWRLEQGELDGIKPKAFVLMIGTNNIGLNTTEQIRDGIAAIIDLIHQKQPQAKVLLLGVFPRGEKPDDAGRIQVAELNKLLAKLRRPFLTFQDIGQKFLAPNGTISTEIMFDHLHPTAKGYEIWKDAMLPTLRSIVE